MIEELPGLRVVHTVSMEIIEHILQPAVVLFGRIAEQMIHKVSDGGYLVGGGDIIVRALLRLWWWWWRAWFVLRGQQRSLESWWRRWCRVVLLGWRRRWRREIRTLESWRRRWIRRRVVVIIRRICRRRRGGRGMRVTASWSRWRIRAVRSGNWRIRRRLRWRSSVYGSLTWWLGVRVGGRR